MQAFGSVDELSRPAVIRLALALAEQVRRRDECAQLRRQVDQLERSGMFVVQGESDLVRTLEANLDEADKQLLSLSADNADESHADRVLGTLQQLLSGVRWRQADAIATQLLARQAELDTESADLGAWLAPLTLRIETLERRLVVAVNEGVPQKDLKDERVAVGRLKQLAKAADEAIRDGRLSVAIEVRENLEAKPATPASLPLGGSTAFSAASIEPRIADLDALAAVVEDKVAAGREMNQPTEILLLKGPVTEGTIEYTFVLRTPSAPGTHGISIHDTFDVGENDWTRANAGVVQATGAVRGARDAGLLPARDQQPQQDLIDVLRDLGDFMYRIFVPSYTDSLLEGTAYPLSITTNDAELPWELLHDGNEFVCLTRPMARMPSGQSIPRRHRRRLARRRLRFLLAYADPANDLPEVRHEVEFIQTRLQETWSEQIEVVVESHPTGTFFNDALRHGDYDVVHYAGHAAFDDRDPRRSGLLLYADDKSSTEIFSAGKIRQFVEGRPLVFLNACQTGKAESEETDEVSYAARPAEGLASAFIYGGALACVGSLWPVYDEPARFFAARFYTSVVEGTAIGQAILDARQATHDSYPGDPTWASFVLFGNPTFRLDTSVEAAALESLSFVSP